MSSGGPMPNPTSKVYILTAVIGAIALIIAALIGRNSGATSSQDQASTTIALLQSTLEAQRAQLTKQPQAVQDTAAPQAPTLASANEATQMPTVSPTAVPPTPTQAPTQAPTPTVQPGTVLYQADWSSGANGWPEAFGWKSLNGMLLNDGTTANMGAWESNLITAPYQADDLVDYAVEAEIQVVGENECERFGIVVRGAYSVGSGHCNWSGSLDLTSKDAGGIGGRGFDYGNKWHKYRFEAKGNLLKVFVDGAMMLEVTDNKHLSGGAIGIWSDRMQVAVRSFKVIKL